MSKFISEAKILCDSVSPAGHRLVSFEAKFPRIILAEVNTHRVLSRNSASSRAIPVEKMLQRVLEQPYMPTHWGKNQKGMQAEQDVGEEDQARALLDWNAAKLAAVGWTKKLLDIGIHKQITNRLIEPFMWHTAVITATEWSNFFHLRDHKDAHPDFRDLAHAMRELYEKSEPQKLGYDKWHLPYIEEQDFEKARVLDSEVTPSFPTSTAAVRDFLCKVSVGRCARVSTLTHEGKRNLQADVDLHDKMMAGGHASPYEHVARPMTQNELKFFRQKKVRFVEGEGWAWIGAKYSLPIALKIGGCPDPMHHASLEKEGEYTHFLGNFNGWVQLRKQIPHEDDIFGARPAT